MTQEVVEPQERGGRLSPADVNGVLFSRAPLTRRGYDPGEVDDFLDRVQAELSRLIGEKGELRDEVTRLRARLAEAESVRGAAGPGKEEASVQAVRLIAVAQQTADQYVAEAEHYSRRITSDARQQYEDLVNEARERAKALLDEADRTAREAAAARGDAGEGATEGAPGQAQTKQELEEQVAYLRTFSQVCRTQLRSYLEALLRDIEDEWGRAHPDVVAQRALALAAPDVPMPPAPVSATGDAPVEEEPVGARAASSG